MLLISLLLLIFGFQIGLNFGAQEVSQIEYGIRDVVLLEKIKLAKILAKHLLSQKRTPFGLLKKHFEDERDGETGPSPVVALQMAIENELAMAPPQYAALDAKFRDIILAPDTLLEKHWIVPEPAKIDPLEGIEGGHPKQLHAELHDWNKKWGNFEKYKGNLDKQVELDRLHRVELREKAKFQQALNLANLYRLGECLAAKLVNIFEEKARGGQFRVEYEELRKKFAHWSGKIVGEFLQDARGKNAQNGLGCPRESTADRVDGLLFDAIESNQFGGTGLEDGHFVDSLGILLHLASVDEKKNGKEEEKSIDYGGQLERGIANGQLAPFLDNLLKAVQKKEQELVKRSKHAQQANSSELDLKNIMLQAQLRKQNLRRVGTGKRQQTMAQGEGTDGRFKALQAILAAGLGPARRQMTALELRNRGTKQQAEEGEEEMVKPAKEQVLLNGIVPLLMGILGNNDEKSGRGEIVEENAENATVVGFNEEERTSARNEKAELELALKKYGEYIQAFVLFAFSECVSRQVAARSIMNHSNAAHKKYMDLAKTFHEWQQKVIHGFTEYSIASGNGYLQKIGAHQMMADVQLVNGLICLQSMD